MFVEFAGYLLNTNYVVDFVSWWEVRDAKDMFFIEARFCGYDQNINKRSRETFKTEKQQKTRYKQLCKLLTENRK